MITNNIVKQHAELLIEIDKLNEFIYGNGGFNVLTDINNNKTQDDLFRNMTEYANKCMQLMSMKNYLKALECSMNNQGIFFENGNYYERIANIVSEEQTPDNGTVKPKEENE